MSIDNFVGTWFLIGSIAIKSEIEFIRGYPVPKGVANWLNGNSYQLLEQMKPTEGLVLTITEDEKFHEAKTENPQIVWYDSEGVLTEVKPFNGKLSFYRSNVYLIPESIPSWATPSGEQKKKLRYNDGDTKICDLIARRNEQLIRTVNVVTDELYLDRIVMLYSLAK